MEYMLKTGSPEKQRTACIVVGVFQSRQLTPAASRLDEASGGYLSAILRRGEIEGKAGDHLLLHDIGGILAERVLLVGLGKPSELDQGRLREAAACAARVLDDCGAMEAVNCLTEINLRGTTAGDRARLLVEASDAALYRFDRFKSEAPKPRRPLKKLAIWSPERGTHAEVEQGIAEGDAIAAGVRLTRDLGNLPANQCTPGYLADQARKLARGSRGKVKVRVLEEKDMERLGMGALLSVARGSREPARLITIEYRGAGARQKPVALVGKGVTFDSGGISIKPSAAMDEMKFDMCGAASVLGTLTTCLRLGLRVNVVGVIPTTENLPDGQASKPGDIVTSLSGQTIEILNTDAEGRLILCDALTYAGRFKPEVVVDIATLTGACVIALGHHASGMLCNDQALGDELLAAGQEAGDRAWQLPLWDDYQKQLDSNFADMANIGGRDGGTITAACFLSRFTRDYRWAHLDIAGTAWKSGKEKGATGRPVPLLTRFLIKRSGGDRRKRRA